MIDPHLHQAGTKAPAVPQVSLLHAADASDDPCDKIVILQAAIKEMIVPSRPVLSPIVCDFAIYLVAH